MKEFRIHDAAPILEATNWPSSELNSERRDTGLAALGAWGSIFLDAKEVLPEVVRLFGKGELDTRITAIGFAGQHRCSEAVPGLIEMLRDPEKRIREVTIRSLEEIGADAKEAVPALPAVAKDDVDSRVRQAAVRAVDAIARRNQ